MHYHKSLLSAAALAGLAAASPAPQNLDLGAIIAAPPPALTGPPISALNQTSVVNTASLIASVSAAVTQVASAQITGAAASNAANITPTPVAKRDLSAIERRDLEKRGLLDSLLNWVGLKLSSYASAQSTAYSTTSTTSTAKTTTSAAATTTAASCSSFGGSSCSSGGGVNYNIKCGGDFTGIGDLQNVAAKSFSECVTGCDAYRGCSGVAFIQASNICYYKNLTGIKTGASNVTGVDVAWLPSVLNLNVAVSSVLNAASSIINAATSAAAPATSAAATVASSATSKASSAVSSAASVVTSAASSAASSVASSAPSTTAAPADTGMQSGGGIMLPGGAPIVDPSTSASVAATSATSILSGSASGTLSANGACATTPEDGTYCGFINPEDPCAPQPDGAGPAINKPDTVDAWMAYAPFQQLAQNATTPTGYVKTFNNQNASTSASSYMGLWTLKAYDPSACAAICNNNTGCTAFNIYIERDPSLNPCKNDSTDPTVWGYWCPLPSSFTNYKCTLWGSNIDASTATNAGGWRKDFQVVITGSNGYDKTNLTTPATIPTYDPPKNCSGNGINGGSYWLGSKFFPGSFNPQLCSAYANATTETNRLAAIKAKQTTFTPCQMFNAYHIYKNSVPMGTYCSLYDAQLSTAWASIKGSWSGRDYYGIRNSWQYQLTTPHNGKCGS